MKNKPRNATIGSIAESVNNNLRKRTREDMQEKNSKNKFECDKCGWKFRTHSTLRAHIDRKSNCVNKFKCDECPKSFTAKWTLKQHKYVHQKGFRFNCDNCGKKFKHPDAKRNHQTKCNPTFFSLDEEDDENQKESQDNEEINPEEDSFEYQEFEMEEKKSKNKFECDKCGWKFRTPANLKRHMFDKKLSCVKEFKCDECLKSFNTKRAFNEHKYVHQKEFRFNCNNCGKKFKHPKAKHKHQTKCNPTSFSPDEEDGENQKENQDNEEIISEEDSFEDEEFEMKSDSSDSDVDFEPELKKKKPNKAKRTTPKRFECKKCGNTFASKASLMWHLNERVKPCVPSKTSTKSFEGFKCDECDKTFSSKSYLEDHKYVHQEGFRFSCDLCGEKFKQGQNYRYHKKNCDGKLKFKYDDCNEELLKSPKENNRKRKRKNKPRKSRNSQEETKSLKSNQTKFKCEKCGTVFANKSNLIRHLENRAIPCDFVKQFKCDECDKSFSSETYLEDHKYAHKEEFRFSCELCGVKFKQKFFLNNHWRKCKPTFISSEKYTKKDSEDRDEDNQDFLSEEESVEIVELEMDSDFADSGVEFKIPDVPEINNRKTQNELPKSPKENSRNRKRRNLKIKARQVINRVMHYHFNEKNADGSITERWLPIFEVEDFDDVLEFEKFMAKVEIGSEEDIYKPENDYFFC